MIKIGLLDEANYIAIANDKFTGGRISLFETPAQEKPGPQAFLVRQAPHWKLPTHFHRQEQFQVVVAGSGMLATHPLSAIAVHYASREAGYGPIVAGADGLDYLTLRLVSEYGAQYLPEEREVMRRGLRKSHATALHSPRVAGGSRVAGSAPGVQDVIAPRADGLAVWASLAERGEALRPPAPIGGSGRIHVVIGGAFLLNGARLTHACTVYSSNDESDLRFEAVDGAAELLTLQFPDGADRDEAHLAPARSSEPAPA